MYDSLLWQLIDDPADEEKYMKRDRELYCLTRLLPRALHFAGYWAHVKRPPIFDELRLVKRPKEEQYRQTEVYAGQCGTFVMMYIDRLLGELPPIEHSEAEFKAYKKFVSLRIFSMFYPGHVL